MSLICWSGVDVVGGGIRAGMDLVLVVDSVLGDWGGWRAGSGKGA